MCFNLRTVINYFHSHICRNCKMSRTTLSPLSSLLSCRSARTVIIKSYLRYRTALWTSPTVYNMSLAIYIHSPNIDLLTGPAGSTCSNPSSLPPVISLPNLPLLSDRIYTLSALMRSRFLRQCRNGTRTTPITSTCPTPEGSTLPWPWKMSRPPGA